ncbi:hypothetical protein H0H81_003407 [Sphagnurus paluster]|uniref:Uncharacterized protein n=1 Tax=Sphagnurus paluster TaxID=117069 RepID=A0A9P7KLL2_9AGAR|nr:hypothetical protein H0H81_003407 [Sphagnurus paluster]
MNSTSLHALSRTELQKLAKENSIKANLRSNVIIDLLLDRQRQCQVTALTEERVGQASEPRMLQRWSTPREERIMEISEILHRTLSSNGPSDSTTVEHVAEHNLEGTVTPDDILERYELQYPPEPQQPTETQQLSELQQPYELQHPSEPPNPSQQASPRYTIGLNTPESSMPGSPDPEAPSDVLEHLVGTIATVSEQDAAVLDQITQLRAVASKLRSKAQDLRSAVRSERARRERIEAYVTYWRRVSPRWTFEDIWEADIRMYRKYGKELELGSSDDEMIQDFEMKCEAMEKLAEARGTGERLPFSILPNIDPPAEVLRRAVEVPNGNAHGKRSRRDAEEREECARLNKRSRRETEFSDSRATTEEPDVLPKGTIGGGALEISIDEFPPTRSLKRPREETDDADSPRYLPSARTEVLTSSGEPIPASSPTKKRMDKGKGKMTPAQVEELLRENGCFGTDEGSKDDEHRAKRLESDRSVAQRIQRQIDLVPQLPLAAAVNGAPSGGLRRMTRAASKRAL